jgi:hypothetical protein
MKKNQMNIVKLTNRMVDYRNNAKLIMAHANEIDKKGK